MTILEEAGRLRRAHPAEKAAWDRAHRWIGGVMRPLSWPFTALLMRWGVTANQVTLATAVAGYGALPMLASGNRRWMVAGGLLIVLYSFLDCVDGNIARARPVGGPPRGKFFDQAVGHSYRLSYFALALGLRGEGGALPAWKVVHQGAAATDAWRILAVGAAATIAVYLGAVLRSEFWNVLGPHWTASKGGRGADVPSAWWYPFYCTATELQSHAILLPICIAEGWPQPFLWVSAAVLVGHAAATAALYLARAWRMR